ncbi:MAG: cysteine desulfurase family protein [Acidimicrobiales bacterium]
MTSRHPVYLDHNATTPLDPAVLEAMLPYLRESFGNPSSDHALGRRAHSALEEARDAVASLIGANVDEIIFTSGGTESNNLTIRGVAATAATTRRRIVTSSVEHPATAMTCDALATQGWTITRVPVTTEGVLDVDAADRALGTDVALVTVLLAQNETGAVMPVADVACAARTHGVLVHSDAAQAIGKIDVDVNELGVDLLSIAGHKFYAPKGVGALYVRSGVRLAPLVYGGGQERGLRPGTENVASIVGLGVAAHLAGQRLSSEATRLAALRDHLWRTLAQQIPTLVRHTPMNTNLPNTLSVSFPGVRGRDLLAVATGIIASTGSACHAGIDAPAATLLAMGVEPDLAMGAIRISLGHGNVDSDVATAADVLSDAYANILDTSS